MTHRTARSLISLVAALALAACNQQTAPAPAAPTESAKADGPAFETVPRPVVEFEAYCFQTNANYERVLGMAKLADLRPVPEKFMPAIEALSAQGKAFIVEGTDDRRILVAATEANTCSVFSDGYDLADIQMSLQDNYHLKEAFKDDTGLQVTELHVPNGTTGTVGDTHKNGAISITYLKDPNARMITISFMPPEVTQATMPL